VNDTPCLYAQLTFIIVKTFMQKVIYSWRSTTQELRSTLSLFLLSTSPIFSSPLFSFLCRSGLPLYIHPSGGAHDPPPKAAGLRTRHQNGRGTTVSIATVVVDHSSSSRAGASICRQDWGPKRGGSLGDGSPPVGSRGRAPRGGLGAKPPEANRYYRIKFEFWVQLHRCVLKNCIVCLCEEKSLKTQVYTTETVSNQLTTRVVCTT